MIVFLARRLSFFVGALFAASLLIFTMIRLAGGDVVNTMLGDGATPQAVAQLRGELGLDDPLPVQYADWMGGLVRGELGEAYKTHDAISSLIADRLPITIPLILASLLLSVLVAVPLGMVAARYAQNGVGAAAAAVSQIGIAVPVVWLGLIFAIVFGVNLGWLPTGGWTPWSEDAGAAAKSLVLPVLTLSLILAAQLSRFVRSALLDVMSEDYVRTARATGMRRGTALLRVGLRNASLPIVTMIGLQAAELIGGTVIVETVFSLPGLSRLVLGAVSQREVIVVQSTVMVLVAFVLVVNLAVDVLYGLLDARVRVAR